MTQEPLAEEEFLDIVDNTLDPQIHRLADEIKRLRTENEQLKTYIADRNRIRSW